MLTFWLKSVQWSSFGQGACFGRFKSLFFLDQGLQDSQIGVLFSIMKIMLFISTPFWSMVADKTQNRYKVLQITVIGGGITSLLLLLPYYILRIRHNQSLLFVLMIIAVVICYAFKQVTMSIIDALTLLKLEDDKKHYGKIRKHGAICWGIIHIVIGILLDFVINVEWLPLLYSIATIPYSFIIYITFKRSQTDINQNQIIGINDNQSAVQLLSNDDEQQYEIETKQQIVNTNKSEVEMLEFKALDDNELDSKQNDENDTDGEDKKQKKDISMKDFVKYICKNPSTLSLYFLMFSVGGSQSVATSLLFVYIMTFEDIEYSPFIYTLLGVSVAVTVLFEVPIFHLAEKIINKLQYKNMIIIGVLLLIIRCIGYSLLTSSTLFCLIFIEPLHGITYALIKLSMVNILWDIFGEKYAAMAQGSMASIKSGLGPLIFVVTSGYIMQYVGGKWLYRGVAACLILSLFIFIIATRNIKFYASKK